MYIGPGCQTAEAGQSVLLGHWTGELRHCVTAAQPMAVLSHRPDPGHCIIRRSIPGEYTLQLWPCGRYASPLATLAFEVVETDENTTLVEEP
jgi:hypothetical protein